MTLPKMPSLRNRYTIPLPMTRSSHSVPISGISAITHATVRSATPLMQRNAWSSFCHSGSLPHNSAISARHLRICARSSFRNSAIDSSTVTSLTSRRWLRCAACNSVSCRSRVTSAFRRCWAADAGALGTLPLTAANLGNHSRIEAISLLQHSHAFSKIARGPRVQH